MGNHWKKIWTEIKTNLDIWFFFGFLLTFTLSVRKVIFYFPIKNTFNEYTGTYIYLSDVLLILTFFFWLLFILCNKKCLLSINKLSLTHLIHTPYLILPFILVIFSFLSTAWSQIPQLALFRSTKLLEFFLFYLYTILRIIPIFTKEKCSTPAWPVGRWNIFIFLILLSASFNSIIGIIQFISQKSTGLFFLRESILGSDIPGVAKIVISGEKYIRAYGFFPHPNIFGGFLLFSIILTLFYLKNIIVPRLPASEAGGTITTSPLNALIANGREAFVPRGTNDLLRLTNKAPSKISHWAFQILMKMWRERIKWLIAAIIILQSGALILTFSKSAILGLVISLGYIFIVPRGTMNISSPTAKNERGSNANVSYLPTYFVSKQNNKTNKMLSDYDLNKKLLTKKIILLITITTLLVYLFPINKKIFLFQSLHERLFYLIVSRGTIYNDPFLGIGMGQSVLNMASNYSNNLEAWQFQPVHNVFLLIWSELGIIGLGLFIWFLLSLFHTPVSWKKSGGEVQNVPRSPRGLGLFHVEQSKTVRGGTNSSLTLTRKGEGHEVKNDTKNNFILCNNNINLSNRTLLLYSRGIILGFVFIMLFDHYFWDIQQGSLLFWMLCGIIVGINKICYDENNVNHPIRLQS